ncbi:MAG: hypothetical protein NT076_03760 [Candidatus Pacearchaeota archaeon]|nr:hypothetical protein [Candidatus Pacearchaeota archaeon]
MGEIRSQTINLESGLECIINHSSKHKCEKCGGEVVWALIQIELVSLAKWDVHKCKEVITA